MVIHGKTHVIVDKKGSLIEDIDTDQIYHNAHLAVTEIAQMGQYAFGNLEGWKDFTEKAKDGDILIVGKNFGAGSSRQHAVDCFCALGIAAILGESFGAIYKRNAINSGFPIMECAGISSIDLSSLDMVEVNFETGEIKNREGSLIFTGKPFSDVQKDIYQAGNLFAYGRSLE